jgi:hypothetical protein
MVVPASTGESVVKPSLLLYLAHGQDPHRCAVGPVLAAAAERAGWAFDAYYDSRRSGRHFGGWDANSDAVATGSLVAGGRHLDHALWLTTSYQVAAVGDPGSPIWPVVEAAGEVIKRTADPAEVFSAALSRLGTPAPAEVMVLDAGPQTALKIVTAPFLYPRILLTNCLAVDVTCDSDLRRRLESLGARRFMGLFVDPDRATAFPGGLDAMEGEVTGQTHATLTGSLARQHAAWGRGTLLGDPDLIAAQLPLAVRHRLIPLYGRPQTDVIERAADVIRAGDDPVYGRQFDDHDFFALGRLGRGLQIFDPDPPFASAASVPVSLSCPKPTRDLEPDDETLRSWAKEGRVLATLILWAGMIRELHCIPRIIDLVAATGLRCGLVITADTLARATPSDLSLLAVPEERGGVLGRVEVLLGSTGRGVCTEVHMPGGELAQLLLNARRQLAESLPDHLMPRGWWPLLDAKLISARAPRLSWEGWRPILRIPPGSRPAERPSGEESRARRSSDARRVIATALRRHRLDRFFEAWRPFDHARPGPLDPAVADAVRSAGFDYMWTKAAFGRAKPARILDDFVVLPFTAGDWDGWSPFYTVRSAAQVRAAERHLLRAGQPAWLASNIDSILWMLPGEVLEKGHVLFKIAQLVAKGGHSGRLVNVTPNVIARYARMLGPVFN